MSGGVTVVVMVVREGGGEWGWFVHFSVGCMRKQSRGMESNKMYVCCMYEWSRR